eukprot:TRINITY_DN9207_c0_g1_i1.p1 TRINITY_DN9207_c0_g1~~TRINITY_DN9207_c0_g1_i1.p1  ORF type:complete len:324 (-),score=57.75 TRINITY_DN9207_c0_g1_i1:28-999(-)
MHLLKALLRFTWLSLAFLRDHKQKRFDVIFVDQISATIPLLHLSGIPILFYCHFPDLLLAKSGGLLKRIYRLPFDLLEEFTTNAADLVLVNSDFTRQVFKKTFTKISCNPKILYPCVDINIDPDYNAKSKDTKVILSLNRYEKKKNIELALHAFHLLSDTTQYKEGKLQLVIAGGYSDTVPENVECARELEALAKKLNIDKHVRFVKDIPNPEKYRILKEAMCLLYTPPNEHFGIVPLEAASVGTIVLACNSGGPLETIVSGSTGFLLAPQPDLWASTIKELLHQPSKVLEIGKAARSRVETLFGRETHIENLEAFLQEIVSK